MVPRSVPRFMHERERRDRTARMLPRDQEGISREAGREISQADNLRHISGSIAASWGREATDTCDDQSDVPRRSCGYRLASLSVAVNDTSLNQRDGIASLLHPLSHFCYFHRVAVGRDRSN